MVALIYWYRIQKSLEAIRCNTSIVFGPTILDTEQRGETRVSSLRQSTNSRESYYSCQADYG